MKRTLAAALVAAVAAVAAGCADRETTPPAAAPGTTAPTTAPPTTAPPSSTAPPREIRFPSGGTLHTDVTAEQRASAVPEERAVAELRKVEPRFADAPRSLALGVLRDIRVGADDGSSLEGRLVWAVMVPDVRTRFGVCDYVLFVDARTGKGAAHFESC